MNAALRIPEILHNILGNFRPSFRLDPAEVIPTQLLKEDEGEGGDLSTLRNAALTCRLFLEPSLDHLWWASNDLTPLFSVLSGFQESDVVSDPGHIRGPISESDCILFNKYARKIRLYSVAGLENICPSAYGQMLQVFNRDHLLPCLQYLSATHSNPVLRFLLSPSLRIVSTNLPGDSSKTHPSLQSFLDLLPTAAPNTTALSLSHSITGHTLDAVPKFLRLAHLQLRPTNGETSISLPKQFVGNLSLMESLRTLYLFGGLTIFPTMSGAFNFPRLEEIFLVSEISSIDPINNFLRVVSLPRLQTLISNYKTSKRIQKASEKDGWITFFRLLRKATMAQLQILSLQSYLKPNDSIPVLDLPLSSIPDLLALPLTSLSFDYFNSVSRTDIMQMVNSWKDLYVLNISSLRTRPNFSALIQIAIGLPRLTSLSINVDCRKLPAIDKTPLLSHKLEELDLHNSLLEEPFKFARCLDWIFPTLQTQEFTSKDVKVQDLWDQASEFLVGLRQGRAEEQRRMRRVKSRS